MVLESYFTKRIKLVKIAENNSNLIDIEVFRKDQFWVSLSYLYLRSSHFFIRLIRTFYC